MDMVKPKPSALEMMTTLKGNDEENRFAVIADSVPVLIAYVDRNCIYRFVNREYQTWFGTEPAQIVGRSVEEVVGSEAWERIKTYVLRSLGGEVVRFGTILPYKTAGERFVDVTYTPDRDAGGNIRGMVALIRDISRQHQAEAKLRKEHRYISTILSTTAAIIVVLDPEHKVRHVNHAFESATGWKLGETKGIDFFEMFVTEEERSSIMNVFRRLVETQTPSRHVNAIRHRDGTVRLIEWSNNVVASENGKVELVIGTGLDITERRELEREILSISDLERHRIGQELHDNIGQRLTALEMFMHGLKKEVREKSPSLLKQFDALSAELRETTREVRVLSRGLAPVSLQADSLELALEQLVHSTRATTGVNVKLDCTENIPIRPGDEPMHLYRIAQEALNNALKHSQATNITISLRKIDSHYMLTLSDDGVGFCVDAPAGMGLRLMRHRAELIGGHLTITSHPGIGTTIRCTLPYEQIRR